MEKIIIKNRELMLISGVFLVFVLTIGFAMLDLTYVPVFAANATGNVSVTATVQSWLVFSVTPTSAALSPNLVDTSGNASVASSTSITMNGGTNDASGWSITIAGTNAGLSTSTFDLIESVATGASASTTLVAGTDGYGANATTTLAGASIGSPYDNWGSAKVGAIASSTAQTIVSKGTANSSTTLATMKIYAAADTAQPAGTYGDTVVLTITSTP